MPLQEFLQDSKSRIESALELHLAEQSDRYSNSDKPLLEAMQYAVLNGGKRLRPCLVFMTGELFGANPKDLLAPAMAVELIHCYSLIHDDLPAMDDDDLRRGKPTVHKAYNEATAILAGDTLQALAFETLSANSFHAVTSEQQVKMMQVLAQASGYGGMCGGQAIDLANTGEKQTLAALMNMHQLKTGALIRSAVLLGAYCGKDVTDTDIDALSDFAEHVGLAFQIQDDILDVISDTKTLGKPQGSDAEHEKSTYVSILGLETAQQRAQECVDQARQALTALPKDTQLLESLASHIINRAY